MSAIHFVTVVGPDGVIRPPAGVTLPEGEIEVAVQSRVPPEPDSGDPELTYGWLLEIAQEIERAGVVLPADMAENHDHYGHGAPKR